MATVGEENAPTSNGVNGHPSPASAPLDALAERDLNQKSPSLNEKSESTLDSSRLKNQDAFVANQSVADESTGADTTLADPKPLPSTSSFMPQIEEKSSALAEDTPMSDVPEAQTAEKKSAAESSGKEGSIEQTSTAENNAKVDDVAMNDSKDDGDAERPEQAPKEVAPADMEMAGADEATGSGTTDSAGGDAPSMSNLAITETRGQLSAPATADTSMRDAASHHAKIAREREEDDAEERSAKRARTEDGAAAGESVSEPTQPVQDEAEAAPMVESVASSSSDEHVPPPREREWQPGKLNDPAMETLEITTYMSRELRNVLSAVKKTKAGSLFKEPVQKQWLHLWEAYRVKVPDPMDIGTIEKNLRDLKYQNLGEVVNHIFLLFENTVRFNGRKHDVTASGRQLIDNIFLRMGKLPAEAPPDKKANKASSSRHAEPRAAAQRRESRGTAPAAEAAAAAAPPQQEVVVEPSASSMAFPSGGTPIIRRDSTKVDNERPKRPVQPPKNRDLPYEVKNSKKKKAQPELRFCEEVLRDITKTRHHENNHWFLFPVDPVAQNLPTYHKMIKKPMDLGTIGTKLKQGEYNTPKEFESDFNLIVKNCYKFNGDPSTGAVVSVAAEKLHNLFSQKWKEKDGWVAAHAPPPAPASASSPGDGEDSEDEADATEPEAEIEAAPVNSATLGNLEARLAEENQRFAQLLGAKVPDKASIELQQTMISLVTNQIIAEKTRLAEEERKTKKPSKSKPSKAKKAGGAAPGAAKKAGGSSGAKRGAAASGRKGTKARVMGQVEKDIVSESINELDGPAMDKAIDIIKKDTHQEEGESGELELDIDQLSSDALGKIYDLILKALPKVRERVQKAKPAVPSPPAAEAPVKGTKPKKHKPMGKAEQERNIEKLREIKAAFQRTGSGSQEPMPSVEDRQPTQEEDEDSEADSEEE